MNKINFEDKYHVGDVIGIYTIVDIKTSQVLVEHKQNINMNGSQGVTIARSLVSKTELLAYAELNNDEEKDLTKMTVKDLKALAKELGVELNGIKKKDLIIKAIEEHIAASEESDNGSDNSGE